MITAEDFAGLQAIIPTPARPGADDWAALDTVDVDETARLVDTLIADGARGIIALGTTGECATLSNADYEVLVDCLTATVGDRVPLFIGATALGTHEAVRRLRHAADRGATGTLLGLPMWQPLTTSMAVAYYRDIAAAFPDLAIMVYANARAFRYGFPPEFWEGVVAEAPTVVAAKVSKSEGLAHLIDVTGGRVRFLPNEMRLHEFRAVSRDAATACWATAASMGPGPVLRMLAAVAADDADAVARSTADIAWVHEPIADILADAEVFASYNIQIEKVRIAEAGYCAPGPIRPPYDDIPAEIEAAARECGRRWRELCRQAGDEHTRDLPTRENP